jgi:O-antigen/teichoic acid export membrane protein
VEEFIGLSSTGIYSVAVLVAELVWVVSSSISQAAYARIGDPDRAAAGRITVYAVHASLIALAALSLPLWLVAAWLLPLLLGSAYAEAMPVLAILLPGVVAYGAASALSAFFTNHAGRPYIAAALAGLSLVSTVALSLVLIPLWGTLGAAAATTVSYVVSVAVSVLVFCKVSSVSLRQLMQPDWRGLGDLVRRGAIRYQSGQ